VGLADPVRPGVAEAVKECYAAGVRVVMITGDYPGTAASIGADRSPAQRADHTGLELDAMDDAALRQRIKT
jgi:Ca2+-transporting ATPase